jgi:glycosidase
VGEEAKARLAVMMLLTLRGTPVLYYGDEIGLPEVEIGPERVRDVRPGRGWQDKVVTRRTPMHWTSDPGGGFTAATATPWLPLGDYRALSVTAQKDDGASVLRLCRNLIALRKTVSELRSGA